MPNSPTRLKARLSEALARVQCLEREKLNAKETETKGNRKESSGRSEGKEPCVCVRERERERERECESVCVCVCVCGHVYVVYEDTNLYNDMGMT